ncbi:hypothetical protein [Pseudooceanicola nanhaiensis]|uniref:hypothetical protein n=1 Tax=Pseudooceanicola nanhaiensis TaxID=375761 RepID=UPI001CD75DFA|nr:hypothetical protein [Pseudooceanicola nanhaiensis]MCA0919750.1 hypothetical protein [Pseudooceanicola nanhaiensis]
MLKRTLIALGMATAVAAPVYALDNPQVSAVDVAAGAELDGNSSLSKFPTLNDDLSKTITAALNDQPVGVEPGYKVQVELTELDISPNPTESFVKGFNKLSGTVTVMDPEGNGAIGAFPIEVNAQSILPAPGTLTVAPSDEELYTAMLVGFAEATENGMDTLSETNSDTNDR